MVWHWLAEPEERRFESCPRLIKMKEIKIDKLILTEKDLEDFGILDKYGSLRKQLYKANEQEDCILIQGAAFVIKGKAFLIMGVGGIDFLDSLAQFSEVDGIIGNGNTLFISNDFKNVYSAQTKEELAKCYELDGSRVKIKFLDDAPLAPLIFLLRSFHNPKEYNLAKEKIGNLIFEEANTFAGSPVRFAGSLKSRLRGKLLATARVVHCARRPTIEKKECLFDSYEKVRETINNFKGSFSLVYTLWSQEMCDAVGMSKTRELSKTYNPIDPITPHLIRIAKDFIW